MSEEHDIGNDSAVFRKDQPNRGHNNPNGMAFQIASDQIDDVVRHDLMGEARRARHEEFSFNNLVAIAVFRQRLEIGDSHRRSYPGGHKAPAFVSYWQFITRLTVTSVSGGPGVQRAVAIWFWVFGVISCGFVDRLLAHSRSANSPEPTRKKQGSFCELRHPALKRRRLGAARTRSLPLTVPRERLHVLAAL